MEYDKTLIPKNSPVLRMFIAKMSQVTNSRDFIKGAAISAETEDNLRLMIDYIDSHPKANYSEIMCFLYRKQGLITD